MKLPSQFVALWVCGTVMFFSDAVRADDPAVEAEIIELARNDPDQQRAEIVVDSILTQAAQIKADDMLERGYLAHVDPDGCGPNFLIQSLDYFLPSDYDNSKAGNNIESIFRDIGFGVPDALLAWNGWLASTEHRTHVLGVDAFFARQVRIGVGIASDPEKEKNIYVIFTAAPPAAGDVLPPKLEYTSPAPGSRPTRTMFHQGLVEDLVGIQSVSIRIRGKGWTSAAISSSGRQWAGQTRVRGRIYRKIRKGRKAVWIDVLVQDAAGNATAASRRFKRPRRR